jgi:hypothetical protein
MGIAHRAKSRVYKALGTIDATLVTLDTKSDNEGDT